MITRGFKNLILHLKMQSKLLVHLLQVWSLRLPAGNAYSKDLGKVVIQTHLLVHLKAAVLEERSRSDIESIRESFREPAAHHFWVAGEDKADVHLHLPAFALHLRKQTRHGNHQRGGAGVENQAQQHAHVRKPAQTHGRRLCMEKHGQVSQTQLTYQSDQES